MAHFMNVLDSLPEFHGTSNHWNDVPAYVTLGMPLDTAQYLDGWTMVAQLEDREDDISMLILMLEANGVASDFDLGVRDAIDAAYGLNADPMVAQLVQHFGCA